MRRGVSKEGVRDDATRVMVQYLPLREAERLVLGAKDELLRGRCKISAPVHVAGPRHVSEPVELGLVVSGESLKDRRGGVDDTRVDLLRPQHDDVALERERAVAAVVVTLVPRTPAVHVLAAAQGRRVTLPRGGAGVTGQRRREVEDVIRDDVVSAVLRGGRV